LGKSTAVITIGCPLCGRRLRLPGSLQGETVQCPMCHGNFTAAGSMEIRAEPSQPPPPPMPPPLRPVVIEEETNLPPPRRDYLTETGEVLCPYCGEFVDQDARRCRYCGEVLVDSVEGQRPFWVRRDCEPHRGPWIQLMGVVSIILGVLSFFFMGLGGIVALPLGIAAWVMGGHDLAKMEAGLMDPSGLAATRAGRQCGLLGVIFSLLGGAGWGLLVGLPALLRIHFF
jgi:uncharacterized Zn-finger protein